MEAMRILTSVLMLCVSGPTLAYPYTRGSGGRNSGWGRDVGLVDYLGGYPMEDQYAVAEYEPNTRYTYANQRPRINKEAVAAWLNAALDDYILNYDTYSDDDGTWYNEMATDNIAEPTTNDDSPMMRFFFNGQQPSSSSPYRYSLEDLENIERRAKMEDNTENQLHALRSKTISKKSSMPVLGGRMPMAGGILGQGQKEEAFDIPATSVRRPVFARTITTQPEEDKREVGQKQQKPAKVDTSVSTTQKPEEKKASINEIPSSSNNEVTSSDASPAAKSGVQSATTSQYLSTKYETLKRFLDREREARRNQDMEDELRREKMQRRGMQKRYAAEEETLPQQLASLKKKV